MSDCLRTGVMRTILHHMQSLSRFADGLVVRAVDSCIGATQMIQPGIFFYDGGMILITVIIFVKICGGKILYDGAAQSHIDDLHTLTDAKYGLFASDTQVKGLELQDVQLCINVVGGTVSLSEEGGSDVSSSGEDQGIASRNFSRI